MQDSLNNLVFLKFVFLKLVVGCQLLRVQTEFTVVVMLGEAAKSEVP